MLLTTLRRHLAAPPAWSWPSPPGLRTSSVAAATAASALAAVMPRGVVMLPDRNIVWPGIRRRFMFGWKLGQNAHFKQSRRCGSHRNRHTRYRAWPTWIRPAGMRLLTTRPSCRHAFLHAHGEPPLCRPDIGWEPVHLALFRNGQLDAGCRCTSNTIPGASSCSTGRGPTPIVAMGSTTIPSWCAACPLAPCPARLLARTMADRGQLIEAAPQTHTRSGFSSFHILFPPSRTMRHSTRRH